MHSALWSGDIAIAPLGAVSVSPILVDEVGVVNTLCNRPARKSDLGAFFVNTGLYGAACPACEAGVQFGLPLAAKGRRHDGSEIGKEIVCCRRGSHSRWNRVSGSRGKEILTTQHGDETEPEEYLILDGQGSGTRKCHDGHH